MKLRNKIQKISAFTLMTILLLSIVLLSMDVFAYADTNNGNMVRLRPTPSPDNIGAFDGTYESTYISWDEFNVPDVEYTQEMFELVNMIMAGWSIDDAKRFEADGYEGISPHFISYTPYQRLATVFNVRDGLLE